MKSSRWGFICMSAVISSTIWLTPGEPAMAAAASTVQKATIISAVKLRQLPSTSGEVVGYMKKGEQVTVLEKTNASWYKVQTASGLKGYTSTSNQYIQISSSTSTPKPVTSASAPSTTNTATKTSAAATKPTSASSLTSSSGSLTTGTIVSAVRLRDKPSNEGEILGYMNPGDQVTVLELTNAYWTKVSTASGAVGYTSASEKYLKLGSAVPSSNASPVQQVQASAPSSYGLTNSLTAAADAEETAPPSNVQALIEQVISTGMTYIGTPYEYGSDRNSTATFDCSAFTRQIFREAASLTLPADSRSQGEWIKKNSTPVYDMGSLKRGDLVFFMNYQPSTEAYKTLDKTKQTIGHVALYLGDNKLLHTYSVAAGGVKVTDFSPSWQLRFMYGGTVLK
ncbi:SH3 domain-containing protein [Paenibacillus sp. JX-17]|uniref:SH3 domain-containing protein n=1 Tax=Paenibacillus lacisoli TaxID=3064525 RepID=A0ABT9CF65_9BACL|nr:SH3 domain-containing C40 family peptidase [Paenibacillus sp. JX-17]MDO7907846.1 SH3 domain-containing protein [Paenibacillus sp. JX-17]